MDRAVRPAEAKVLAVFGTRPEVVKLAPVLAALRQHPEIRTITVASHQQVDLLPAFLRSFTVTPDHSLDVMADGQPLNRLLAQIVEGLDAVFDKVAPDMVVVQGDTTTALAGAMAARMRQIPVTHVEAGLRTGDLNNPFPEESNRRLISASASLHCAATSGNVETLIAEGIAPAAISLTGNPIVDSLHQVLAADRPSPAATDLLAELDGRRLVLLTLHRRESFGAVMVRLLEVLRDFVERHPDVALVFPVHPNPAVRTAADSVLGDAPRVRLVAPLDYADFLHLFRHAWLVASDSGGVQEEAPTIGTPLLILRDVTERPESVACGAARLVGRTPERLAAALEDAVTGDWARSVGPVDNPFGDGRSGRRIADVIVARLDATQPTAAPAT